MRCGASKQDRNIAFAQYMEVVGSSERIEVKLGFICMRWSTSDQMDDIAFGEKPEGDNLIVRKCYT